MKKTSMPHNSDLIKEECIEENKKAVTFQNGNYNFSNDQFTRLGVAVPAEHDKETNDG